MATHQYSDHNQSYVPDARLEEGRSVCDVDAGAGSPFADLVSHIILYIPSLIFASPSQHASCFAYVKATDVP